MKIAKLSNAQRMQLAPRAPKRAALLYLAAFKEALDELRQETRRILFPVLEELGVPSTNVRGGLDVPHVPRADAVVTGTLAQRLGELQVAITRKLNERNWVRTLDRVARTVYEHNVGEMSRVLSINVRAHGGVDRFVQQFVRENVSLIESVARSQHKRIEKIVTEATAGQHRVETLQAEIMRTFDVSESRAALIARDQTLKANADLTAERQKGAGITEYVWTSSNDERVRGRPGGKWEKSQSDHWALDGTRQSWASPPITNETTGATNHPGKDYSCRCVAVPIVEGLLDIEDESVSYPQPSKEQRAR